MPLALQRYHYEEGWEADRWDTEEDDNRPLLKSAYIYVDLFQASQVCQIKGDVEPIIQYITVGANRLSKIEREFNALAEQWYRETKMLSFVRQKAIHPAYQKIIGMGPVALPFILQELRDRGGDWIWALEMIVRNENPAIGVTHFKESVRAWLDWGKANGHIE